MKKFLRLIALILAITLLACGCSSAPAAEEKEPASTQPTAPAQSAETESKEPVKLTVAILQHMNDTSEDPGTKYGIQKAMEDLGYEIEWITVKEGETTERLPTILAGDLPDVFWGPFVSHENLVIDNKEFFIPLEDKIETMAPDVYRVLNENVDGWQRWLSHDDGHIYSLPGFLLNNRNSQVQGVGFINKAWLDNLGLEVPTTQAELEAVLTAFRDQDADGDGDSTNEIPLDYCQNYWSAKIEEIAHSFGLTLKGNNFYDIVDGKVVSIIDTPAYKAFLEYMNYLTKEGLINPEGVTQTAEQYTSNIANGKTGIFFGWSPMTFITDSELASQYVALPPISADGYTFRVAPAGLNANRANYLITTECENVEAAMALYNYFFTSEQIAWETFAGPEGLAWELVDGKPYNRVVTPEEAIEYGYDKTLADMANTTSFTATIGLTNNCPLIIRALDPVPGTGNAIRIEGVEMYEKYYAEEIMPKAMIPADAREEFVFATDGLSAYIYSYSCDAIINGVTDDNWNAYVAGLSQYGMDAYIQYYQNCFDGTF